MASGADTHTHTHTHTYIRTEVILRNQARAGLRPARAWFKNIINNHYQCINIIIQNISLSQPSNSKKYSTSCKLIASLFFFNFYADSLTIMHAHTYMHVAIIV